MDIAVWVRCLIGAAFLVFGMGIFLVEVISTFHLDYVLNRMHAAATGDTLGIFMSLIGLMLINGADATSLKFLLVIVFLWFASPVSSHLIARLEVTTNEETGRYEEMKQLEEEK